MPVFSIDAIGGAGGGGGGGGDGGGGGGCTIVVVPAARGRGVVAVAVVVLGKMTLGQLGVASSDVGLRRLNCGQLMASGHRKRKCRGCTSYGMLYLQPRTLIQFSSQPHR